LRALLRALHGDVVGDDVRASEMTDEEQWEIWLRRIADKEGITVEEVRRRLAAGEASLQLDLIVDTRTR
jgi:hypothetical protein